MVDDDEPQSCQDKSETECKAAESFCEWVEKGAGSSDLARTNVNLEYECRDVAASSLIQAAPLPLSVDVETPAVEGASELPAPRRTTSVRSLV